MITTWWNPQGWEWWQIAVMLIIVLEFGTFAIWIRKRNVKHNEKN